MRVLNDFRAASLLGVFAFIFAFAQSSTASEKEYVLKGGETRTVLFTGCKIAKVGWKALLDKNQGRQCKNHGIQLKVKGQNQGVASVYGGAVLLDPPGQKAQAIFQNLESFPIRIRPYKKCEKADGSAGTPHATQTDGSFYPYQAYEAYHKALTSGKSIKKYLSAKMIMEVRQSPVGVKAAIAKMRSDAPIEIKVYDEKEEGNLATCFFVDRAGTRKGQVKMVKENGMWKMDGEEWSSVKSGRSPQTPGKAAKSRLAVIFEKYNQACGKFDKDEMRKYGSAESMRKLDRLDQLPAEQRGFAQELIDFIKQQANYDYHVIKQEIDPNKRTAELHVKKNDSSAQRGVVVFVNENGAWKVDKVVWSDKPGK